MSDPLSRFDRENLEEATADWHRKMEVLAGLPWRHGRSNPRNLYAVTTGPDGDWKEHPAIGHMATPELAAEAVRAHNERLWQAPVFGELDEDGRLVDSSGHKLWHLVSWLPSGREDEAAGWMAAHGIEVYRMYRTADALKGQREGNKP
jgi:hypothetical protein